DAHLVGVGAEVFGGGEGGGDVVAARAEVAEQHDGLALAHVAELELLAKQHRELGVVECFMHGFFLRHAPLPRSGKGAQQKRVYARFRRAMRALPTNPVTSVAWWARRAQMLGDRLAFTACAPLPTLPSLFYSAASFQVSRWPLGLALSFNSLSSSRS